MDTVDCENKYHLLKTNFKKTCPLKHGYFWQKCQWTKSMMRKQELLLLSDIMPLFNYTPDYLEKIWW